MAQRVDRTVTLNQRWTDWELLVLLAEVSAIVWLQPFIAVILVVVALCALFVYFVIKGG